MWTQVPVLSSSRDSGRNDVDRGQTQSPDRPAICEHPAVQPDLPVRLEIAAVRAIGALPPSAKRRIAGAPIRRDGLELDLDAQVLLKLAERNPPPPAASRTPAGAREELRHSVSVVAGPPIGVASVHETTIAGADGP